ncbi:MAG: hypothetical protein M3Q03_21065 [Chloroflexota bacterium]|nr:hypothetical protein [Chloroflexota bacterium]
MTSSPRLASLRFSFERLYRAGAASRVKPCPPLHALLSVPIRERLVLLALTDGAEAAEIKRTLKVKDEDVRLTSHRMREAVAIVKAALLDPFDHLPDPDSLTNDDHRPVAERHLRQLLFASTAVCLFGEGVPAQLAALPLRDRVITYCLLVEEMRWSAVEELLGCSEHAIRQAIAQTRAQLKTSV